MGRAIVRDPKVSCSTSRCPISTPSCRVAMRAEIKALHQRLKTTTVYVTHDQVEAMTMADRIAVVNDGPHRAVWHAARSLRPAGEPVRRAVHRSPAMNILEGAFAKSGDSPCVKALDIAGRSNRRVALTARP